MPGEDAGIRALCVHLSSTDTVISHVLPVSHRFTGQQRCHTVFQGGKRGRILFGTVPSQGLSPALPGGENVVAQADRPTALTMTTRIAGSASTNVLTGRGAAVTCAAPFGCEQCSPCLE